MDNKILKKDPSILGGMLRHPIERAVPQGFRYIPNFISEQEKHKIMGVIMSRSWCDRLKREQQYYGIKYYQTKHMDSVLQSRHSLDYFPLDCFDFIIGRLKSQLNISNFTQNPGSPNQVLVNKYLQRDYLACHVEDVHAFGACVLGLSLGDVDYLRLVPGDQFGENKNGEIKVRLEDKSIYILEGEARYGWRHGIGRTVQGKKYKQENFSRISLTFRDVIETRRKL